MGIPFDLFVLDGRNKQGLIALGRRGDDTAIVELNSDVMLAQLGTFGRTLGKAVTGDGLRPSAQELESFGHDLFRFLFAGELRSMYDRLPNTAPISLQILSNRPDICEIPWEYLVLPDKQPSPHRDRSIVRVHPTCGIYRPEPKALGAKTRILFASSDPIDQPGVDWAQIERVLDRTLNSQAPDQVEIKVVEAADRAGLVRAINTHAFEIFHFFGHGTLRNNIGHLVLQDAASNRSEYFSARALANVLSGKDVRLAILSACLSGAGDFGDDFSVIATALIESGIPAVIANQYPIPVKSIAPFVGAMYETLMAKGNIDQAVASGRVSLYAMLSGAVGSKAVIEWGIPTLYRLPDAQQIFQASP